MNVMEASFLEILLQNYEWQLSLYAGLAIIAATYLGKGVVWLVPTFAMPRV